MFGGRTCLFGRRRCVFGGRTCLFGRRRYVFGGRTCLFGRRRRVFGVRRQAAGRRRAFGRTRTQTVSGSAAKRSKVISSAGSPATGLVDHTYNSERDSLPDSRTQGKPARGRSLQSAPRLRLLPEHLPVLVRELHTRRAVRLKPENSGRIAVLVPKPHPCAVVRGRAESAAHFPVLTQ